MTSDIDIITASELLGRVRELRAAGRSPKQIARALGVRPAVVAPLVRAIAQQAADAEPDPELVGCWVSPGWSQGMSVAGHDDWRDAYDLNGSATNGLACVVVARRYRSERVSICGYLADVYCLGVKDALGPRVMNERDLPAFLRMFFSEFEGAPLEAPLDLARHLVWGAVDYARGLGFQPHPEFRAAAGHLGDWEEASALTFGKDGKPLYIQGPHDDANSVMRTLTQSVGGGNFDYLVMAEAAAGW